MAHLWAVAQASRSRDLAVHSKCSILHSMDTDTASLARVIGSRVRAERQSRRWTLDQLAEAAGTSRRSVINVEQGAANPSVGILLKLSDALGIGLPTLVAPLEPKPLSVTRAGEAAVLWSGEFGGRRRPRGRHRTPRCRRAVGLDDEPRRPARQPKPTQQAPTSSSTSWPARSPSPSTTRAVELGRRRLDVVPGRRGPRLRQPSSTSLPGSP